ncbi:hypothetical protein [Natronospira bacteriovora]|uniref:DUF11 domain-containing protein n=1 Tax=Natronospira bacteriovora TaxID=3069753 RepID=A0ABU0W597_9GAMM|nr:hypothetical protein [Natronospira sp. AB-CW4]MDQ2069191.1 hypothetical protein [Natronospira sp. AB-CW4]
MSAYSDDYLLLGVPDAKDARGVEVGGLMIVAPGEDGLWQRREWIDGLDIVGQSGSLFGISSAVEGDGFFVGALWENRLYSLDNTGKVYQFYRDPETGFVEHLREIARPEPDIAQFGTGLASERDWLIVGATLGEGTLPSTLGAAYVFHWSDSANDWVYQQKLLAPDGEEGGRQDAFGSTVKLAYPWLAVHARNAWVEDIGERNGATYLFRHDPDADEWAFFQKISAVLPDEGAEASDTKLMYFNGADLLFHSGQLNEDLTRTTRLEHFVWNEDEVLWQRSAVMRGPEREAGSWHTYGWSAMIRDDRLYLGFPSAFDEAGRRGEGAVRIYDRDPGAENGWRFREELRPPWSQWGTRQHALGVAVAPAGPYGVIVLSGNDSMYPGLGSAAYVYQPDAKPVRLSVSDTWTDQTPVAGRTFRHHWRIENSGDSRATNVLLRMQYAPGAPDDVSGENAICEWNSVLQSTLCLIEEVPAQGHVTVTLKTTSQRVTNYRIDALLVSDQIDEDPDGRETSVRLDVVEFWDVGDGVGCAASGRPPTELLLFLFVTICAWRYRFGRPEDGTPRVSK